jgi:hypothetical protein
MSASFEQAKQEWENHDCPSLSEHLRLHFPISLREM